MLNGLSGWCSNAQIQTVVKKVEVFPDIGDTNITSDSTDLANATKPLPIVIDKKTLEFKSGMNVLGRAITLTNIFR